MARVTYGALITALQGSIGGWSFHVNRSGQIARLRPASFRSRTGKQNTEIANFTSLISGFSALTLVQKTAWDAFALANTKITKWGEVKTLTGQNWYVSINAKREQLSLARLDVPPTFLLPNGNNNFTLVVDATKIEVTKAVPASPANTSLIFWGTPPILRTTTSLRSELRFLVVDQSQPFGVIDLTTDWETAFNTSWPPSPSASNFNIFIGMQIVREVSGIASALNIQGESLVV